MPPRPPRATAPSAGPRAAVDQPSAAAWLVLGVLLLFSIAAPLNQGKVPPIMPLLMQAWQLSVGRAGLLMSVYAITGLILALPAGFILQRAGNRVTGLLAGGSIVLGGLLGALSASVPALLAGRVVEGIGTSFMAVLAPAIVAQWFASSRRGTALGIWAVWVPVGSASMMLLAPPLAAWAGWRGVWWFGCAYAGLVTLLYLAAMGRAPAPAADRAASPTAVPLGPPAPARVLRSGPIWLLGLTFGLFCWPAQARGHTCRPSWSACTACRSSRLRCWPRWGRCSRSSPYRRAGCCRTASARANGRTCSAWAWLRCCCH